MGSSPKASLAPPGFPKGRLVPLVVWGVRGPYERSSAVSLLPFLTEQERKAPGRELCIHIILQHRIQCPYAENAKIGTIVPIFLLFFAFSWIGFLLIRQPRKIVHTGIQCLGDPLTLFESVIPLSALDFGIIALVDPCQHLHLHLGQPLAFS